MKAGMTASQRRRRGDNALTVAVDPHTRRLLRLEEARSRLLHVRLGKAGIAKIVRHLADTHKTP